ncbi:MAG: hypothetical protein QOJ56_3277 [Mycobacterium sp.]|nr:hypothetical protein [Mycobacterium sp.]
MNGRILLRSNAFRDNGEGRPTVVMTVGLGLARLEPGASDESSRRTRTLISWPFMGSGLRGQYR